MYKTFFLALTLLSGTGILAGCANGDESADPGKTQKKTPDVSLANTYWKLTEINGRTAVPGAGEKELSMILTTENHRMRGFAGCNRFTGTYAAGDGGLKIGPLAVERKACAEAMEQEQRFLEALERTARFTISGDHLALYSGDEKPILRFVAVYLD